VIDMRKSFVILLALALCGCRDNNDEKKKDAEVKPPSKLSRTEAGESIVELEKETQERAGVKTAVLEAVSLTPETVAWGRLIEDPGRTFVVRAPIAGTIRGAAWPAIGQKVAAGTAIGSVEPRMAPVDRLTLTDRLAGAKSELAAATASASASRAAYERMKKLNADGKNASDRAVQEADAKLKTDEARVEAAQQTVQSFNRALTSLQLLVLIAEKGGSVAEVMVQPGESVEAGQPLMRLTSFDTLLARVDVAAGQRLTGTPSTARIAAAGFEDRGLQGERVPMAVAIDPSTQGQPFVFRIRPAGLPLRPGQAVAAYLRNGGAARKGVVIPHSALVRAEGSTWAFLQQGEDKFIRREVHMIQATERGWFTTAGFEPGQRVVVTGAQVVLSEESKSEIKAGDEN
jgi:RND family efflux transporter MFP subunit